MTVDNDRNNDNANDNSMTILKLITIVMRMTVMIFMFFVLLRAWDKKNFKSPRGIEPQTLGSALRYSTTEPERLYGEQDL